MAARAGAARAAAVGADEAAARRRRCCAHDGQEEAKVDDVTEGDVVHLQQRVTACAVQEVASVVAEHAAKHGEHIRRAGCHEAA